MATSTLCPIGAQNTQFCAPHSMAVASLSGEQNGGSRALLSGPLSHFVSRGEVRRCMDPLAGLPCKEAVVQARNCFPVSPWPRRPAGAASWGSL